MVGHYPDLGLSIVGTRCHVHVAKHRQIEAQAT